LILKKTTGNLSIPKMLEELQNLNIYLIGMMGCGKSTVGQMLASKVGYRFLDTDHLVEQVSQQSVASIFAMAGEEEFRVIESKVLSEVSAYRRLIVATGGGLVMRQENWGHLRQGLIVWIDVPAALLWERLAQDRSRPLLQSADPQVTLREILATRQARYAEADLRIVVGANQSPTEVANNILEQIPSVLKSRSLAPGNRSGQS
jgi:shikimate kinase